MKERIEELRRTAASHKDYAREFMDEGSTEAAQTEQIIQALYTCTAALIEALQESAKASLPRCGYNYCWFEKGHTGNCSHD